MSFATKNIALLLIKLGFASLIILLLLRFAPIDFSKVESILKSHFHMFVFFILVGITIFLNTWRWVLLLKIKKVSPKFLKSFQFSLVGIFFNFLLPSSVGGDLIKAVLAARSWGEKKAKILLSVFIDRVFGLTLMMTISLVGFALNYQMLLKVKYLQSIVFSLLGILFVGIAFLFFTQSMKKVNFASQFFSKLKNSFQSILGYFENGSLTCKCFVISFFSFSTNIVLFYMAFDFFSMPLPVSVFMLCVPLGTVLMSLPIAPAGLGVGQAAYFFIFNLFGEGYGEMGVMAVTVMQVVYFLWALIGALAFAFVPIKLKELNEVSGD